MIWIGAAQAACIAAAFALVIVAGPMVGLGFLGGYVMGCGFTLVAMRALA